MNGYAVVDLETTGLHPSGHDRIVEVAVVWVSPDGSVEDSWCTLVNPERNLGPQDIHGITAADVHSAPTFAEIAGTLAGRLRDRIVVAHNARFDVAFLSAAYRGLGLEVPVGPTSSVCTMQWAERLMPGAPRTLAACCAQAGVPLEHHHSALADATAAAGLLRHLLRLAGMPGATTADPSVPAAGPWSPPWADAVEAAGRVLWPQVEEQERACVTRGDAAEREAPFVSRLVDSLPTAPSTAAQSRYLALLDRAMPARHLSVSELTRSAGADGERPADPAAGDRLANPTAEERQPDPSAAESRPAPSTAPERAHPTSPESPRTMENDDARPTPATERFRLRRGDAVVFTGHMSESRQTWEDRARAVGLVPHATVTKKVALVVAADPDSLSGKTRKAAGYGIPIVSEGAFGLMLTGLMLTSEVPPATGHYAATDAHLQAS